MLDGCLSNLHERPVLTMTRQTTVRVQSKRGEMKEHLAWNSGKSYRQSYRPISITWHTRLAMRTLLFHAKRCFISPLFLVPIEFGLFLANLKLGFIFVVKDLSRMAIFIFRAGKKIKKLYRYGPEEMCSDFECFRFMLERMTLQRFSFLYACNSKRFL